MDAASVCAADLSCRDGGERGRDRAGVPSPLASPPRMSVSDHPARGREDLTVDRPSVEVTPSGLRMLGIHHVRLPVSDVLRSRDWYGGVFEFEPILDFEEEERVVGVVLEHPCGIMVGLHAEPARVSALVGFSPVAFCVGGLKDLDNWSKRLDHLGVAHSSAAEAHIGWSVMIPDPDGLLVQLHTVRHPAADEA